LRSKHVQTIQTILAAVLVLLVTLSFYNSPGNDDVKSFWEPWASKPDSIGLVDGFAADEAQYGYPPVSSIIFFGLSRISHLLQLSPFDTVKLALLLFLLATSIIFWAWTKNFALTISLHLAFMINSLALGYIDVFFAPWLLLSLWALQKRQIVWATILFMISFLIKWQPLIIAPFIFLYLLNIDSLKQWRKIDFKGLAKSALLPAVTIGLLIIAIFGLTTLRQTLDIAFNNVFLSGNALNFNWIITHWLHVFRPDDFGPLWGLEAGYIVSNAPDIILLPKILFYATFAVTIIIFFKREKTFENVIKFSLIGYWAYFTFNTGVHDNHLFIAVILSMILFWLNKEHLMTMIITVLASTINMIVFYGFDGKELPYSRGIFNWVDIALPLAIFNVIFFLTLLGINLLRTKTEVTELILQGQ
jgi:hypothetical protein